MGRIYRWQSKRPICSRTFPLDHVPSSSSIPRDGHEILGIIVKINLVVPRIIPILAPGLSFEILLFRSKDFFSLGEYISPGCEWIGRETLFFTESMPKDWNDPGVRVQPEYEVDCIGNGIDSP